MPDRWDSRCSTVTASSTSGRSSPSSSRARVSSDSTPSSTRRITVSAVSGLAPLATPIRVDGVIATPYARSARP